jgi:O-acetylhomoserine (thiol)-lyase
MSRTTPVYRTSSFVFKDTEHAADLFALKRLGNIYSRLTNPTVECLEKRMTALEGGVGALGTASGTAAIFYAIINCVKCGEEVVSSTNLYGGTYTMFNDILPNFGITVRWVDPQRTEQLESAINDNTRAIFIETIGNPKLNVPDFDKISNVAREAHVPLIVDSTFTTPYLFKPFEYGADVVVHSLTKWIGGHGAGIGGIVVDSGAFDWTDPKFKMFNEPEPSYHGLRFSRDLGDLQNMAYILRMRVVPLRNLGACMSPDNAWIFLQGLETLSLRMEKHCKNSLEVAGFLSSQDKVEWVVYPGLESDTSHHFSRKYFSNGHGGGVVVFGIKGGSRAAVDFIEGLELFSHLANVGDAKSLAIHPASTTHSQLSSDQQIQAGITPSMIRLSVGIEDINDILEDLEQALSRVG